MSTANHIAHPLSSTRLHPRARVVATIAALAVALCVAVLALTGALLQFRRGAQSAPFAGGPVPRDRGTAVGEVRRAAVGACRRAPSSGAPLCRNRAAAVKQRLRTLRSRQPVEPR
jgi:hypothetical protein